MLSELTIVVPAYNEANNIKQVVKTADQYIRDNDIIQLHWLLVDDGSTDNTWMQMKELAQEMPNVHALQHVTNKGLGVAIWTGMAEVKTKWCAWMPADGQFKPELYIELARLANGHELVMVMRHEKERAILRQILSLGLFAIIRLGLGYDPHGYSGVFLSQRKIVQDIPQYGTTGIQNFVPVLYCQRYNLRIEQIFTVIQPRLSGFSKVTNVSTMLKTLFDVLKLSWRFNRDYKNHRGIHDYQFAE